MGEAKALVKGKSGKVVIDGTGMGILPMYDKILEDLDTAAMVKQEDLLKEGDLERAKNRHKLALIYCAMSLTRHAREALKEYDMPLDDAAFDENA